jgi:hypothetical protein
MEIVDFWFVTSLKPHITHVASVKFAAVCIFGYALCLISFDFRSWCCYAKL